MWIHHIAISKLLSPSHATHSISLYSEYTSWMETQGIDHNGFKGFTVTRFGMIAEIVKEFLCHRQSINPGSVQVHTERLVPVLNEIYSQLGDAFIFPLMDLLEIDGRDSHVDNSEWNWAGVRPKLPKLKQVRDDGCR